VKLGKGDTIVFALFMGDIGPGNLAQQAWFQLKKGGKDIIPSTSFIFSSGLTEDTAIVSYETVVDAFRAIRAEAP
jgi:hypothetical protein